ncbi:MAG: hypothetical protein WB611_30155, partial [Stellaceae bacterium]
RPAISSSACRQLGVGDQLSARSRRLWTSRRIRVGPVGHASPLKERLLPIPGLAELFLVGVKRELVI